MWEIRVVTYNICHGKGTDGAVSLTRTAQVLNDIDADMAALQEVDKRMYRSCFRNQVKSLARYTSMKAAFAPTFRFLGISSFGNALLSRYSILGQENYCLPGGREQRSLQKCTLYIPSLGKISFFNTHLGLTVEERAQQSLAIAETISRTPFPALLVGDFNCTPDAPELQPLLKQLRCCSSGPINTYPSTKPFYAIDQIYMSSHWELIDISAYSSGAPDHPSDHLPLVCSLRLLR